MRWQGIGTPTIFAILSALMVWAAPASAADVRIEISGGAMHSEPDVEFGGVSDSLETDTGYAGGAGLWVDKVGVEWISLGVQYLNQQGFDFSKTASGTILGATITGTVDLEPTINSAFVNIAARGHFGKNKRFHPYIGGGIGVARSQVDASVTATLAVGGTTFLIAGNADDDDVTLAGQAFVGFDVDFTKRVYSGVNVRYLMTDANLFGADVEFRNAIGMAVLGVRF